MILKIPVLIAFLWPDFRQAGRRGIYFLVPPLCVNGSKPPSP
jgi:hypothetical protein